MTSVARYAHGYSSGMSGMGVTKHFLAGFKTNSRVGNLLWYCKSGKELKAREITSPRGELTTIILLNGQNINLTSEFIILYS